MYDFDKFSINLQKAVKLSVDSAKYYGSGYIAVSYTHLTLPTNSRV